MSPSTAAPAGLVVVGAGRVGSAFLRAAAVAGVPTTTVGRGDSAALSVPHPGRPILVCTRADDLAGVIAATSPENRADLVFVQNGMLRPLLAAHGLADNTQGLVYFAATSRTERVEPGAPSLFWGPHAAAIVALLAADAIPARVVPDRAEFSREIGVKLAWNIIFGLLGERHAEPVGETVRRHRQELTALAVEIAPVLARGLDTTIPVRPLVERLVAYSLSIPTFRASVKELPWRNGWVATAARTFGLATPLHDRLLRETGHGTGAR
ncbi:MAG: hypothetical protein Q8P18_00145 [Pseudomonadota bacterium]|nr:hypothetical protein [Pseudomonadota bacterium]